MENELDFRVLDKETMDWVREHHNLIPKHCLCQATSDEICNWPGHDEFKQTCSLAYHQVMNGLRNLAEVHGLVLGSPTYLGKPLIEPRGEGAGFIKWAETVGLVVKK